MSDKLLTHYDAIILGSGQAGNPLAAAFAAKGKRVALVERALIGGTCVNYGCTPTKTMVASAEVAYLSRRGPEFGIHPGSSSPSTATDIPLWVDMPAVRERKRAIVKQWREGSEKSLKDVDIIHGEGSFLGPKQILVRLNSGGQLTLTADLVVIDTGLSPAIPSIPGLDQVPFLDNASVMELDQLPEHLLILGGGYIGLEFAQMFRRFGSRITVVQDSAQLLPHEDEDIAEAITKILREDGIEILLNTHADAAAYAENTIHLTVRQNGPSKTITGTHLLVAAGRHPNTDRLNLSAAGISTNTHGFVQVDDYLQTNVPGVYAVGDVNGGPEFTHVAYDDYRILNANLLESPGTRPRNTRDRILPYCVFIDPQLGRVGLSEKEAAKAGIKVRVARLPMSSVARAMETSQSRGFMKALVHPESKQILGAAILGLDGGEIMGMLQIAMLGKLPYPVLQSAVLAHPTLAEALNNLFRKFDDKQP
jgi:pyruvate/2-oxoglutarate dehydrogenase complex dihydrolipoamide dehydrogenase (E3) component